ncbi:hypothetical protein PTTG_08119, partial [Puccinia triticina 1-1 BBBD Race 1]
MGISPDSTHQLTGLIRHVRDAPVADPNKRSPDGSINVHPQTMELLIQTVENKSEQKRQLKLIIEELRRLRNSVQELQELRGRVQTIEAGQLPRQPSILTKSYASTTATAPKKQAPPPTKNDML